LEVEQTARWSAAALVEMPLEVGGGKVRPSRGGRLHHYIILIFGDTVNRNRSHAREKGKKIDSWFSSGKRNPGRTIPDILRVQYSLGITPAHHKNEETFTALRTAEEFPSLNL